MVGEREGQDAATGVSDRGRGTEEEAVGAERGARAYARFGAGRKTGHQEPVVAAKRGEEGS